ncbi:hypothetical protein HAX54_049665, partial [Datura stramonium]|nr:hypothetical protein [Datura stramonium]
SSGVLHSYFICTHITHKGHVLRSRNLSKGLTTWLKACHGPNGTSDGHQRSERPSVEPLKENFLDFGVTAELTNHRSHDGLSLVLSKKTLWLTSIAYGDGMNDGPSGV